MKKCAYCTAENREEAIFCRHCRRPLQARQARTPKEYSFLWLLAAFILIGLSSYFFLSRSFFAPAAAPPSTPISDGNLTAGPAPTRTQEPITISTCVENGTRIRRGPGTQYETIGGLASGACLTVLGRNEEASWVFMVSEDYHTGWVDASLLRNAGNIDKVSIRDNSALANPARATLTSEEIAHGAQAYLTEVSATNLPQSPLSRYAVPCFETANRIGDNISCRMERAYCDYLPAVEGSPTVCNDRPAPDQTFALVVFGEDWSDYDGQCIMVSGYLEIARGALQIQALQHSQVSACE